MSQPIKAATLAQYEQEAFALYFVNDIRYPYISVSIMTVIAVWLLHGNISNWVIALWVGTAVGANALREAFVHYMRPLLDQGRGFSTILRVFALLSLVNGLIWGAFTIMYFNASDPMTVLVVGSYVAGHVGGAVTPLSIYLPALYLFVLPTLLPGAVMLAMTGNPVYVALSGLTLLFLFSMLNYARITNRLHRESMRLRFENQRLIGDLELRNADVEDASHNKSLFLAGVSHDLKQPIRAIAMYAGFLRHNAEQDMTPSVVSQTAGKIETAVSAIHSQITRLLELSRLESGAMPLNMAWFYLDDVVESVHQLMAPLAIANSVQLRLATGRKHRVWADRVMLESILSNFLSNAIKHSAGGRVYVGPRLRQGYPEGQQLCLEVRDNGSGIEPHQLALMFDAYRSFDDRQTSDSDSHGLGLAIAKTQASYLNCDIDVRSQPGVGSTFTLCGLRNSAAGERDR